MTLTTRLLTCPKIRRPRPGLTLLEVLLAMAIFLISLAALGRLVDMGGDHELEARLNTRGARLAQAKLAEVEAGFTPLTAGSGTFDDDKVWSWSLTADPQGPPNLYLVKVTVSRDLKGRQFQVTIAQMMLDPAVVGSAAQASDPNTSGGGSP